MRWLGTTCAGGVLLVAAHLPATAQDTDASRIRETTAESKKDSAPVIREITFVGLHRIAPAAAQAQITSRVGRALDDRRIQHDVKALSRLGWFADLRVATQTLAPDATPEKHADEGIRVIFQVEEQPYLVKVEHAGSHVLSASQIDKLLAEKGLTPRLGEPSDEVQLERSARTIEGALAELGHPEAHATIKREEDANGILAVRYEINDGPHLPVGRIEFAGHPTISPRLLRSEMHRTKPGLLASWRGKGAFTPEGFAEDRANLLMYFQNHGYPEARVGNPKTWVYTEAPRRWAPWPFHKSEDRLAISVPIEAGPLYRVSAVGVSPELTEAGGKRCRKLLAFSQAQAGATYSAKSVDDLRHDWVAATARIHSHDIASLQGDVEAARMFDPDTRMVHVRIAASEGPPYIVGRIEFRGEHRFSDRYLRRRIGLQEGQPFNERALELGLARLAKTTYFRQIHKEDIHVEKNEQTHTVDVTIRVAEAGQQHAALCGGQSELGSTLGLAYSLFDVLQREELLSAHLDGGPQSLQMLLGLAMEGFLGSRSSLAISVFENVLRPHFQSSVQGPFYTSRSEGLNTGWSYAVTQTDSVSLNYGLTQTNTDYSFDLPASLTGLPTPDLAAKTTSSAIGFTFAHGAADNRFSLANSVSGGALGGTENVLRSNEQYARVFRDPLFNHQNTWAFRTTFSGAGSYQGEMPFYARLFSGDSQVRGLTPGELGPYAVVSTTGASGNPAYTALPSGANVITAANAEYRVPLGGGVQAAGFFDAGAGWLLPNWLGSTKPTLLLPTNGVLHGSFGLELRWTIPGIQVPVRTYVAVNVLRLNRLLQLPDGSLFRAHDKLFSLGWALGNLF